MAEIEPHEGPFGSCCDDLGNALHEVPNSRFRVDDNSVLYLSIGFVDTDDGVGWFEQAVLHCPFCGAWLQDPNDIASLASGTN